MCFLTQNAVNLGIATLSCIGFYELSGKVHLATKQVRYNAKQIIYMLFVMLYFYIIYFHPLIATREKNLPNKMVKIIDCYFFQEKQNNSYFCVFSAFGLCRSLIPGFRRTWRAGLGLLGGWRECVARQPNDQQRNGKRHWYIVVNGN